MSEEPKTNSPEDLGYAKREDAPTKSVFVTAILATRIIHDAAFRDHPERHASGFAGTTSTEPSRACRVIHDYCGTAYLPRDVKVHGTRDTRTPGGFRCCRVEGPAHVVDEWMALVVEAKEIVGDASTARGFGLQPGDRVWSVP